MNQQLLPGDKVIWRRVTSKNGNRVKYIEIKAEVFYKSSPERVAIRFPDKFGTSAIRFVPLTCVEKIQDEQ